MTIVTGHAAKTHLSRWINRVLEGEDVVITRGKVPVGMLKPVATAVKQSRIGGKPKLIVHMAEDFDAPLDDFKDYME